MALLSLNRGKAEHAIVSVTSQHPLNRNVRLAFGTAVFTLLALGTLSYRIAVMSRESSRWVRHTNDVIGKLQDLAFEMERIRSSTRGFFLTGQESYLEARHVAESKSKNEQAVLRDLTADNPEQQRRLVALEALTTQAIQFADMVTNLHRGRGSRASLDALRGGTGQQIMAGIEGVVGELRQEESRLLVLREADAKRRLDQSTVIMIIGVALGLLTIAATGWGTLRGNSRRELAEEALRKNERLIRALIDNAAAVIYVKDLEGRYLLVNRRYEDLFHLTQAQMVGKRDSDFFTKEQADVFHVQDQQVLSSRKVFEIEDTVLLEDGTHTYASIKFPISDAAGSACAVGGMATDITDRKRAQAAQALLAGIVEFSDDAIISKTLEGVVTTWNAGAERIFGYRPDEMVGKPVGILIPPDSGNEEPEILARIIRGECISHYETVRVRKDGQRIDVSLTVSPVKDADGKIISVSKIARDISHRKRAEEALRNSEERYLSMLQGALKAIFQVTLDGKILFANPAMATLLGFDSPEELKTEVRGVQLYVRPERRAEFIQQLQEQGSVRDFDVELRRRDGRTIWAAVHARLVRGADGNPILFEGLFEDITEHKLAQERLLRSEEEYRLLFDRNPSPMWVFEAETLAFLAVNDAAVRHYGYSREEFLRMTVRDIRPSEEVDRFVAFVKSTAGQETPTRDGVVFRHRKKDGTLIDVEVTHSHILFQNHRARLVLASDVTQRNNLQSQLLQSQKMESVGLLAGGVAHDFNNLLGIVIGSAEMLQWDLPKESPLREYTVDVLKAAHRAADLTRQLLAFGRQQVLQPKVLMLNSLVLEFEKMLRRIIPENIEIRTALTSVGTVRADAGQIEQVIMNLVVNARDAMPSGGRLAIETGDVELDDQYARQHAGVKPGHYVMLAVSDTGHGMTPEVQARIFDPFYTTKERGKGTGLGLGSVHGIVKQSGGSIYVYSEPGRGTTFKIYLPNAGVEVETFDSVSSPEMPRGSETILVAEDEAGLRSIVSELLSGLGYTVLLAEHGADALRVSEAYGGPIHLLVTDVIMPGIGGRELATRLAPSRPTLNVLYLSGYTDDSIIVQGVLASEMAFLQKPFAGADLARKVREVLETNPVGAIGKL